MKSQTMRITGITFTALLILFVSVLVIIALQGRYYLLIDPQQQTSLARVAILDRGNKTYTYGDVVAYAWQGGYGFPVGAKMTKKVGGMAGDDIVIGKALVMVEAKADGAIGNAVGGTAKHVLTLPVKAMSLNNKYPLHPITAKQIDEDEGDEEEWEGESDELEHHRIPKDRVFLYTPSTDSLDSRYSAVGLIPTSRIVGRVYPLF